MSGLSINMRLCVVVTSQHNQFPISASSLQVQRRPLYPAQVPAPATGAHRLARGNILVNCVVFAIPTPCHFTIKFVFLFKRQVVSTMQWTRIKQCRSLLIFYVSNIHLNVSKRNSWRGVWVTNLTCDCKGHTDTVTRAVVNRLWHGEVFFFLFSRRQGQNWRVSDSVLCWCERSSCLGFYGLEGGPGEKISRKYW